MKRSTDMKKRTISQEKKRNYRKRFLKEAEIPARFGKTTYIRKEHHQKISTIVRTIGKDEVSIFSYIDNVLAHHFASFQDDITALYEEHNTPIF